jgi:hypothetical protein
MFLRYKDRRKDGKQHRYWSVVENTRVAGGRMVQRHGPVSSALVPTPVTRAAYSRAVRRAILPSQRTWFENIAERKPRRRQLTEYGMSRISGRDVRKVSVCTVPTAEKRLKSTLL